MPRCNAPCLDMSTTAQINDSSTSARPCTAKMSRLGRMHKPKVEQANSCCAGAPDIPSVLVETAFISNPMKKPALKDPDYQDQLADALMRGAYCATSATTCPGPQPRHLTSHEPWIVLHMRPADLGWPWWWWWPGG